MGKRVTIAYEAPRATKQGNRYVGEVRRALTKMGADQQMAVDQEEYVRRMYVAGVPASTTAALLMGHPHMHAVIGVAAEETVHRAEIIAPEPIAPANAVGGPFWLVAGHQRHVSEARDSGAAFTQVVKDPERFATARARAATIGPLDNDRQLHRFLREDLESQDQEIFVVVGVDLNNDLRLYSEVARGQRDRVAVTPADILRPVIIEGCQAFAVAHNHPSGNAAPSDQDRILTRKLREATAPYGGTPTFLDHLVVGSGGSYFSFADGKMKRG